MEDNDKPTPEQCELQKAITKVAAELEKKLGPICIEHYEQLRAIDKDTKVFIGALHMCLCCMMAKVYGISSQSSDLDGTNLSLRETFVKSVAEGTDHFIKETERLKPQLMVNALLATLNELRAKHLGTDKKD